MKIPRKKGDVNGFDTNEIIAYLQDISIGMNQGGPISRFALSSMMHPGRSLPVGEFKNIDTENSKLVVDQLVERYWWLCPMRELIMDHGAEFGAHRVHQDGKWDSDFKKHIERHGIKPILAKVKHPQTNGKLERWFGEYQRHRLAFSSFEEFREWYNNRPHGSLDFEHLETPEKAFRRKMRPEMYFAIGHRLFGLRAEYESFTRNEFRAGAKYFRDYTLFLLA